MFQKNKYVNLHLLEPGTTVTVETTSGENFDVTYTDGHKAWVHFRMTEAKAAPGRAKVPGKRRVRYSILVLASDGWTSEKLSLGDRLRLELNGRSGFTSATVTRVLVNGETAIG
jgi:hypothetical protein